MKEPVLFALLWGMSLYQLLLLGVKIVAAVVAGIVGWFVGGILGQVLYRVAFHNKMPAYGQLISKTVGAAILGVLAFFLVNFGLGGGFGFGPGGGGAPDSGDGTVKVAKGKQEENDNKGSNDGPKMETKETLIVEMIPYARHEKNPHGKKHFLIRGDDTLRDIPDLKEYLRKNKDKQFKALEFRVYQDSKQPFSWQSNRLQELAADFDLKYSYPAKWQTVPRP